MNILFINKINMDIRESVFDRISDSFTFFKNNFSSLFLPFFIYNFISITIVGTILQFYFINSLSSINDYSNLDAFSFLNNSVVVIWMVVSTFFFILYLLAYVYVLLGLLKSIKQWFNWEKIDMIENIKYWIWNFWNSMKTYWYIFVYIAMIPALLFILWGILFNLSYYLDNISVLSSIGWWLMLVSFIIFIFFSIYRWTKARFALYSAVNANEFSKENFNTSVKYTDNNWWRIVWNYLLVWILIWFLGYVVSALNWLISFGLWWWSDLMSWLSESYYNKDYSNIKDLISNYINNFSFIAEILWNIIDTIFKTWANVYIIVFSYIFYLRLEKEYLNNNKTLDNSKNEVKL